ncbi:hypothetical protein Bca101_043351 [Brassica carinata]
MDQILQSTILVEATRFLCLPATTYLRRGESPITPVWSCGSQAAESQTGLLQSLLIFNGKIVPLVKQPVQLRNGMHCCTDMVQKGTLRVTSSLFSFPSSY